MTHLAPPPLSRLRSVWSSRSPLLLFAIKSAVAAGFSWQIANSVLGEQAAALALISAVIVVQVTSWKTVRISIERTLGVIIGVSLAVAIAHFLGRNIWTITLMIFIAQIIGLFLQSRGQSLATQIPISAALALVLGATVGDYPLLRLLGTLIGGFVGIIVSLLLSPPMYVFRARDAIAAWIIQLADAFPELGNALAVRLSEAENRTIYTHIRGLEQRVQAIEQALSLGIDSTRLNPWAHRAHHLLLEYPEVVLTLDRLVRQMRRIAYTINEPEPSWSEIAQNQEWAFDYAQLLKEIGSILASAAEYIRSPATTQSSDFSNREALSTRMEHAQQQLRIWQTQLAQVPKQIESQTENAGGPSFSTGYRLAIRGSILTDLRRMLEEVHAVVAMTSHPSLSDQPSSVKLGEQH